jgi:hypothetical protein
MPAKKRTTSTAAKRALRRNTATDKQSVSTEDGLTAARAVAQLAEESGIDCAIAGGLAMHLYGFTRATQDVDMIADELLELKAARRLSFGGETYRVQVGRRQIAVDWIVRDDEKQDVYEAALADAVPLETKLKVISPEWLVILKQLAGRGKDHLDLLWLLRERGLVDRSRVARLIRKIMGKYAYWALQDLESVYLEADLLRARDERTE